jgi:hypothetical protein
LGSRHRRVSTEQLDARGRRSRSGVVNNSRSTHQTPDVWASNRYSTSNEESTALGTDRTSLQTSIVSTSILGNSLFSTLSQKFSATHGNSTGQIPMISHIESGFWRNYNAVRRLLLFVG